MKKIVLTLMVAFSVAVASVKAQETKQKPITTPGDKVHNTIHPKHKRQHGSKYKYESVAGKKSRTTVRTNHKEALEPKRKIEKKTTS